MAQSNAEAEKLYTRRYARMISPLFALLLLSSATAQNLQPVITAINPASAPTLGAAAFIVQGSNFGTDKTVLNLTLGSAQCQISYVFGSVLLATPLPAGIGRGLNVVLQATDTFSGQTSSCIYPQSFSYYAPVLNSLSPQVIPTSGQSQVTIYGQYFGINNYAPTISIIGGTSPSRVSWVSDTSIVCVFPPGAGAGKSLSLQVGQQFVTSNNIFSYASPQVSGVNPSTFLAVGSQFANVTGLGFAVFDASAVVYVGGTRVLSSFWSSDTSIFIKTGSGVGISKDLAVTVAGQVGTKASCVSYYPPSPLQLKPSVLRTDGSTILTVFGSNFGKIFVYDQDMPANFW